MAETGAKNFLFFTDKNYSSVGEKLISKKQNQMTTFSLSF